MPEFKKNIDIFGRQTEVTDVPITEATECFSTYALEDGSVLRVKTVATSILRIDGQYGPDGKPIYLVLTSANTVVLTSRLTKPGMIETKAN